MKKFILFILCLLTIASSSELFSKKFAKKAIKIGIMKPSHYGGRMIEKGVKMAINEINAQGGVLGRRLFAVMINDGNSPDKAKLQLRFAIESKKIDFIVGGFNSALVSASMDVMAQYKKLWLGTGGASPKVIYMIKNNYEKYKYYFRVGTMDALFQGPACGNFVVDYIGPKYGLKKIALIGADSGFSKFMLGMSKRKLKSAGYEIVYERFLPTNTKDFSPVFAKIKEKGAKIIIQAWPNTEATVFIKQFHAQKVPAILVGAVVESLKDEYYQETSGACVYQADFSPQSGPAPMTRKTIAFSKAFKKTYKESAGYIAYPAYDTIYLLKAAIEKSKSFDSDVLVKTLENMEYEGNIWYKFTKYHDLTMGIKNNKVYAIMPWYQWQPDGSRKAFYPAQIKEVEYTLAPWVKSAFKKAGIIQ